MKLVLKSRKIVAKDFLYFKLNQFGYSYAERDFNEPLQVSKVMLGLWLQWRKFVLALLVFTEVFD
jgi:hypothetical protein